MKTGEVGKPLVVGDGKVDLHDSPFIAAFNIYYYIIFILGYFILRIPDYHFLKSYSFNKKIITDLLGFRGILLLIYF
ncbi:MAG TPA: hypothetical protein DDW65_10425 [Firmicutes bacterium]|nr:hypothetical protein [Bacillota bacterium]